MKSPNDITSSDLVAIGSIGKSHGLKGSFFLNSYCDPEDNPEESSDSEDKDEKS